MFPYGAGMILGGAGALGGILGSSQYKNPMDAANPYFDQIPGMAQQAFNPYMQAGANSLPQYQNQINNLLGGLPGLQGQYGQLMGNLPTLQGQYGQLLGNLPGLMNQYGMGMNNPQDVLNNIGKGFQQSPGFKFQVDQATGAANRAASAGGMLGSPAEQQELAGTVNNLANQDYYNYLSRALGVRSEALGGAQGLYGAGLSGIGNLYNTGLQGAGNLYGLGFQGLGQLGNMGLNAASGYGNLLSNALQNQGALAAQSQQQQNEANQNFLSGGLGGAAGFLGNLGKSAGWF